MARHRLQTLAAAALLAFASGYAPVSMGLNLRRGPLRKRAPAAAPLRAPTPAVAPSPTKKRVRLRRAAARVGAAAGALLAATPKALAAGGALVSPAVVEAAAAVRAAVQPGSIQDRIVTDHITLLTTVLREAQVAKFKAMRNLLGGGALFALVFGVFIRISTKRSERLLREREIEMFGEYRDASTMVADDDDDEEDEDEDDDEDDGKKK